MQNWLEITSIDSWYNLVVIFDMICIMLSAFLLFFVYVSESLHIRFTLRKRIRIITIDIVIMIVRIVKFSSMRVAAFGESDQKRFRWLPFVLRGGVFWNHIVEFQLTSNCVRNYDIVRILKMMLWCCCGDPARVWIGRRGRWKQVWSSVALAIRYLLSVFFLRSLFSFFEFSID
jgi:hypothetical protein